jgi:hypothetical protein
VITAEREDSGGAGTALAEPDTGLEVSEIGTYRCRTLTLAAAELSQSSDRRERQLCSVN